ncbi:diaminopimelate epimerase [Streptomyces sp. NPDC059697]|uniref:diaminopimelate epimerase n=1 Tax=Streptomyces sp. NPDC059697 TaxID=3346912 RepID=UPI0036C02FC0
MKTSPLETSPALHFSKMHGAGNDIILLDLRDTPAPSPELCRALADRHTGVGCDMILGVGAPRSAEAVASYSIWTADGSPSQQCGNGARCVAAWLVRTGLAQAPRFVLDSPSGSHAVEVLDPHTIRIAMGVPQFSPWTIPLAGFDSEEDVYEADLGWAHPLRFSAVSTGNPHAVIEVDDVDGAAVAEVGPALQNSAILPPTVNVGFVQVVSRDHLRLRVHEYGAGETLACGSGACAAAAVLMRRGCIDRHVSVSLPGGTLQIHWPDDAAQIHMAGPAAFVYEGKIPYADL